MSNGGVYNFSANDVNLSDVSVKNIFGELGPQRERFRMLAIAQGAYKDAETQAPIPFWMAQQVGHVYPEYTAAFGKDGKVGVKEHALTMTAFKVIQELDLAVLDHDDRIASLEAENVTLRAILEANGLTLQ
jgi:hypothetical protein